MESFFEIYFIVENLKIDMEYTAVIRTLGMAGEKYQTLLDSLARQTLQPAKILVYIAEGYPIPPQTIGREQYIYVKKGMVAQRALPYAEVETEYVLFLDDDVYLSETAVETMSRYLAEKQADVISPDVFPNAERPRLSRWMMSISGRMVARRDDGRWGYKVMRNAGYSYNVSPKPGVYWSQTNAGPCFLCRKADFLKIHFEEELWMDRLKYALGDDQVMFYKMYLSGLKQLTWFHTGIKHLDAGTATMNDEKERNRIFADLRFKTIFWHRFICRPDPLSLSRIWSAVCLGYALGFTLFISLLKGNIGVLKVKWRAIRDGVRFIKSDAYRQLPPVEKHLA